MNISKFGTTTSVLGLAALAALLPTAAFAQDTASEEGASNSSEIVVTAQRRAERSVDVPITVTSLGADQLDTANVSELADITKITPGLRFDNAGGFFQPTIRGIGTAVTTSGGGGNVGIYIDGFYSPNPLATNAQLLNVQSIQVLKGPQGTLFGRNTTGGAILIQSLEPSTDASAEFKASYGRYDEWKAQGYATFGIGDSVAFDIEGLYSKGNGWQRDISNGNRRVGGYKNWQVRLGAKVDLSDSVSFLLRFQHGDIDDPRPLLTASYFNPNPQGLDTIGSGAPFGGSIPGTFTYDKNRIASGTVPEYFHSNSNTIQATLKADLGFADLTSYTQYRKEDVDSSLEIDYSGVDIFQLGLPNINRTFSQELLLNSKSGGALQWTAGLFYFSNKDVYVTHIDNFGSAPGQRIRFGGSGTTTKSYAAFIDGTYELSPQWFVTAGVRYAKDKVVDAYWNTRFLAPSYTNNDGQVLAAPGGVVEVPSISDSRVTPRFVLRYKPDEQSSIYASYTKGYKAAVIDVGGSCQNSFSNYICGDVQPESINAFEVGYKYDDRTVSLEVSGFYYDYKNLQVSIFRGAEAQIVNAAKSKIYGIDGQVRYRMTDAFEVNLGAAWTHARYKEFIQAPIYMYCPAPQPQYATSCNPGETFYVNLDNTLRNTTMQRTPEFTGNVGARYTADVGGGELTLSGNLSYSSKFNFGPSGIQFPQKGFETLSLRAAWTDPSDAFTLAVFGDNVTNSRYKTQVQYASYGIGTNWSQPTTYGVEIGAKF